MHAQIPRRHSCCANSARPLWEAKWELPLPLWSWRDLRGVAGRQQAAVITAAYVLVVEVLVHREMPSTNWPRRPRHRGARRRRFADLGMGMAITTS
jgi:TRAP-type C4-dicarboxylate transport system permease large subunit